MTTQAVTTVEHPELPWIYQRKLSVNVRALHVPVYLHTYSSQVPAQALCPPLRSRYGRDSHSSMTQDYLCLLAAWISQGSSTAFT